MHIWIYRTYTYTYMYLLCVCICRYHRHGLNLLKKFKLKNKRGIITAYWAHQEASRALLLESMMRVVACVCLTHSHKHTYSVQRPTWHKSTFMQKKKKKYTFPSTHKHTCTYSITASHSHTHTYTLCSTPLLFREKSNYFLSLHQCLQKPQWGDSLVSQWNSLKQLLRE